MIFKVEEVRSAIKGMKPTDIVEITEHGIVAYRGRKPPRVPRISVAELYRLSDMGLGPTEIGEKLGASKQMIDWHLSARRKLLREMK